MIKTKNSNNNQYNDCIDNSFAIKKEEKINSKISIIEPTFQPIIYKSGFSNKK